MPATIAVMSPAETPMAAYSSLTLAAPNARASGSATAPTVMPATKSLSRDDAP